MKKLSFIEENKDSYDVLYECVIAHPVKGIEEIIKAATIVEKLKEVGEVKGEKVGDFQAYKLKTVPVELELEDEHFKYIKNCFESTPMSTSIRIELLARTAKLLKAAEAS